MRTHRILDPAATLLGVALLIVTAVHITDKSSQTFADDLSFVSAILFIASCLISHWAIRYDSERYERWADSVFATAVVLLLLGILSFWL